MTAPPWSVKLIAIDYLLVSEGSAASPDRGGMKQSGPGFNLNLEVDFRAGSGSYHFNCEKGMGTRKIFSVLFFMAFRVGYLQRSLH